MSPRLLAALGVVFLETLVSPVDGFAAMGPDLALEGIVAPFDARLSSPQAMVRKPVVVVIANRGTTTETVGDAAAMKARTHSIVAGIFALVSSSNRFTRIDGHNYNSAA